MTNAEVFQRLSTMEYHQLEMQQHLQESDKRIEEVFRRLDEGKSIKSITVSGIRCQDMRLRLKYVDIPSTLEPNIETAIRNKIENGTKNLYVLVNYTGLYSTRNILKRMEGEK